MEYNKEFLDKKYKELDNLKKEINEIEIQYARLNCKYKSGDIVTSLNIKDTVFMVTNDCDFSYKSDIIYIDCSVVSTSNKIIKSDIIYSLPENQLTLENNG